MSQTIQRLTAVSAVLVMLVSSSAFAEKRSRGRTDLERLAADLNARLGHGSAVIERGRATSPSPVETRRTEERPRSVVRAPQEAPSTSAQVILAAMNEERVSRGLRPLRMNAALSAAAGDRVSDMFAKHYFDHVAPDGLEPFHWVEQRGYRYRLIGENLALGFRGVAVVDGWMRSPGHRENLLHRGFDEVGIAVGNGSPQRGYKAPLVVAMYGSR